MSGTDNPDHRKEPTAAIRDKRAKKPPAKTPKVEKKPEPKPTPKRG